MRINGQTPVSNDLDELIGQLQSCPSPFENEEGVESSAQMVGQGQAGLSSTTPIGTKNIGACVGIIARDPQTGRTGCLHVDRGTNPLSLSKTLESISNGPLEISLIGARYATGADVKASEIHDSRHNLQKVLNVLNERECNIVAALTQDALSTRDVLDTTNVFVDPKTGKVKGAIPESPAPDGFLAYTKCILTGGYDTLDMDTVFDDTKGRLPVQLGQKEAATLNHKINGAVDHEISDFFIKERGFDPDPGWIGNCIQLARSWNAIYQTELAATAQATGADHASLRNKPLYIGTNATAQNAAALDNKTSKAAIQSDVRLKTQP